jgi:hypothetical protein
MDEETPEASYTTTIHGSGTLYNGEKQLAVIVAGFTLERGKYSYDAAWTISGMIQKDHTQKLSTLVYGGGPLRLEGVTASGTPVFAGVIRIGMMQGSHFRAEAADVQIGPSGLAQSPERQTVTVYLTETSIAREEFDIVSQFWTGEVKGEGEKATLPTWSSQLGTFELSVRFEWRKVRVGTSKARTGIPRPAFFIGMSQPTPDIEALIATLVAELPAVVRILSFLSRHHIDWCEIAVHSLGGPGAFAKTNSWKRSWSTPRPSYLYPLVNRHRLPNDFLDRMLTRFRDLPYKDAVGLAIGFLIGADESEYFENNVISAFTSLETLVSAISEHEGTAHILPPAMFEGLRDELKTRIKEYSRGRGIVPGQRAALYAKLLELSRAPIVERIVELVQRHQIEWSDLWPVGANLEQELRQAYERRSALIHAGRIVDADKSQADRLRMKTLAERLLYKLLGGQPEWLEPSAYDYVPWLSRPTTTIAP